MLHVTVPDLGNPYRDQIAEFVARAFPANLDNSKSVLEAVTDAMVASGRVRFGPKPAPENLVAIRGVIRSAIEAGKPIPVLVPWGSKKPRNDGRVDIAELGALKSLASLQDRVMRHYAPGLDVRIFIEDIGGFYLFASEGEPARAAARAYTADLQRLVRVLGIPGVGTTPESTLTNEDAYTVKAEEIRPALFHYLADSDAYAGLPERLDSFANLSRFGWQGAIPREQRDYYRDRYARVYPGISKRDATEMLARYFAGSWARYQIGSTGARPEWGPFIKLNFTSPVPGVPEDLASRRLYYRTLPENLSTTHLPPWRSRGYLKLTDDGATPKLTSWMDQPARLRVCHVVIERDGESVTVDAPHLVAE